MSHTIFEFIQYFCIVLAAASSTSALIILRRINDQLFNIEEDLKLFKNYFCKFNKDMIYLKERDRKHGNKKHGQKD